MVQCQCSTTKGLQCKLTAIKGLNFCNVHKNCTNLYQSSAKVPTKIPILMKVPAKIPTPVKIVTPTPAKIPIPKKVQSNIPTGKVSGSVRIGQKQKRGIKGDKATSLVGYKNIDVTSGSFNKVGQYPATTLSPMKLGPVTDNNGLTAKIFENYWQFSKLFAKAGHIHQGTDCTPTKTWVDFRQKGFNLDKGKRHPLPKEFGYAKCSVYNDYVYNYVDSRKAIYVPIYAKLIENLPIIDELRKMVANGHNIMIIDGDGAPKDVYPNGLEMNQTNWDLMINDPKYPFGHGYVVAALIAGNIKF